MAKDPRPDGCNGHSQAGTGLGGAGCSFALKICDGITTPTAPRVLNPPTAEFFGQQPVSAGSVSGRWRCAGRRGGVRRPGRIIRGRLHEADGWETGSRSRQCTRLGCLTTYRRVQRRYCGEPRRRSLGTPAAFGGQPPRPRPEQVDRRSFQRLSRHKRRLGTPAAPITAKSSRTSAQEHVHDEIVVPVSVDTLAANPVSTSAHNPTAVR